ncbi:hypothetical protein ZWY2020_060110 [Hordeum vulgare]|nr:hypothetical protein ZWY2020_060110 [Hordeum vulgare]
MHCPTNEPGTRPGSRPQPNNQVVHLPCCPRYCELPSLPSPSSSPTAGGGESAAGSARGVRWKATNWAAPGLKDPNLGVVSTPEKLRARNENPRRPPQLQPRRQQRRGAGNLRARPRARAAASARPLLPPRRPSARRFSGAASLRAAGGEQGLLRLRLGAAAATAAISPGGSDQLRRGASGIFSPPLLRSVRASALGWARVVGIARVVALTWLSLSAARAHVTRHEPVTPPWPCAPRR